MPASHGADDAWRYRDRALQQIDGMLKEALELIDELQDCTEIGAWLAHVIDLVRNERDSAPVDGTAFRSKMATKSD